MDSESLKIAGMDADGLAKEFYLKWLAKQSEESIVKNENVLSDSNENSDRDSEVDEKEDLKLKGVYKCRNILFTLIAKFLSFLH